MSSTTLGSTRSIPPFLAGSGSMGQLIADFDWAATPVGELGHWPVHLRLAVATMLRSSMPMALLWGESGTLLYNQGYAAFSRQRHPGILGLPVSKAWPEARDFNSHVMRVCLAGGTLDYQDIALELNLHGTPETVWFNLHYSPITDEQGTPCGVLALVSDTSSKVRAERRLVTERERFAQLFEQSPSFMAMLEGPEHRIVMANPGYRRLVGPRALIGLTLAEALPEVLSQGYMQLLDGVYRSGEALTAHGARYESPVGEHYVDFVFQPIRDAHGVVTGIFVEGVDVTGRMKAERRRTALAQFTDLLRSQDSANDICSAAAELLGRTLGVSRAGYALVDHSAENATVPSDWTRLDMPSVAGTLNLRHYGSFVDDLKADRIVRIADVAADERTRTALPACVSAAWPPCCMFQCWSRAGSWRCFSPAMRRGVNGPTRIATSCAKSPAVRARPWSVRAPRRSCAR